MGKYTPGPWSWFTGHPQSNEQDRESERIRFLIGSDGQGFAHTVGLSTDRDVANADLIAAAPDLLEALESCVSELAQLNHECAAAREATHALSKAWGMDHDE